MKLAFLNLKHLKGNKVMFQQNLQKIPVRRFILMNSLTGIFEEFWKLLRSTYSTYFRLFCFCIWLNAKCWIFIKSISSLFSTHVPLEVQKHLVNSVFYKTCSRKVVQILVKCLWKSPFLGKLKTMKSVHNTYEEEEGNA